MTILDRNWGNVTATSSTFTVTRSTGSYGTGTVIVIMIASNTVFNTPATATLRASSTVAMGLWMWDLPGAGQASIACTNTAAGSGQWYAWELSAGSNYVAADAFQSGGGLSTVTAPTLTPSAGDRHMLAMACANATFSNFAIQGWSNSYTGFGGAQSSVSDFTFSQGADRNLTADGVTGYTTVATFSQNMDPRGALHGAYINAAGDVTPPTVPTGLGTTAIGPTSADLSWTASTDAVGVTGYDIQVIGT